MSLKVRIWLYNSVEEYMLCMHHVLGSVLVTHKKMIKPKTLDGNIRVVTFCWVWWQAP